MRTARRTVVDLQPNTWRSEQAESWTAREVRSQRRRKSRLKYLADMQKNIPSVYVPSLYKVKYDKESRIKSVEPVNQDLPVRIKIRHIRDISAFTTQEIISAPRT